jgi:uncharacterized metal-binding protein
MWDKINKVVITNAVAVIVILASFTLLFMLILIPVPRENEKLIDIMSGYVVGTCVTAVMGWLYTTSKTDKNQNQNP